MLNLVKDMHFRDVLAVMNQKRDAIQLDLAELKAEGVPVVDIEPQDLLSLELAGYIVSLETGKILSGPRVLVL